MRPKIDYFCPKFWNMTENIHPLIFGCMGLGGSWDTAPISNQDIKHAHAAVDAALGVGIRFFDHADIYTKGKAEVVFGHLLRERPELRGQLVLQSKTGIRLGEGPMNSSIYDLSKSYILAQVELILRRLNTEYLDVLLLHRPDPLMEADEVAEAFDVLQRRGWVRQFGVSNMSMTQLNYLQSACSMSFVANQIQLGLRHTVALDLGVTVNHGSAPSGASLHGVIEGCQAQSIAIQAYSALDRGFFTGKSTGSEEVHEIETRKKVAQLAHEKGVSPEAIVLAWLLRIPGDIRPIIGTTNPERIRACSQVTDISLTRHEWYDLWITARGGRLP